MEDFDEIYNKLNNDEDSELHIAWEEANKEKQKIEKILIIECILVNFCFLIIFLKIEISLVSTLMFLLLINIVIFLIFIAIINSTKKQRRLKSLYKNTVIKTIINNFYDNAEYLPNQQMPEYIYKQLNYESYNRYKSDDYIKAQIDKKYNFEMAEILTEEEEKYTNSDGRTETRITKKFYGLFSKIEIDKSINAELKIVENGKMFLNKNRLKMDSSEFEKYFDVQTSNKIIGMQILTADIMEELVNFERKMKIRYDIYIKNNEIYLRFHTGPMFEMKRKKDQIINKEVTYKYFTILKFTYNVAQNIINAINNVQI